MEHETMGGLRTDSKFVYLQDGGKVKLKKTDFT